MASGPTPMMLGSYAFRSFGFGFKDVKRKLETPWADMKTAGAFEALQWTGPGKELLTITGVIFPAEFGGMEVLEALRQAAEGGQVMPLVTGSGAILGNYVLVGVDDDQSMFDAGGNAMKDSYTLHLRLYPGLLPSAAGIAATVIQEIISLL